jgi:hypothetical protein
VGLRTIGSRLEEAAAEAAGYIKDLEDRIYVLEGEVRGLELEVTELRSDRADRGPRLRGPVRG